MSRPRAGTRSQVTFAVGDRVFFDHTEDSWLLGTVRSVRDRLYVCCSDDGTEAVLAGEHLHKVVQSSLEPVHDLLRMSYLHDSSLMYHVRTRYWQDVIYTNIGPIVLALNPYDYTLPHYVDSNISKYIAEGESVIKTGSSLLPHSWSIAHNAYFLMRTMAENQSILVSGESGAGKTEAAKIVLRYLGELSTTSAAPEQREVTDGIIRRVVSTSPILESFGNAKTLRNDNSSRFGKFMKVQFDADGVMTGAHVTPYLLERSRIISHAEGERSYHSFYQLVCGASAEDKKRMRIGAVRDFKMLMAGGAPVISGVDDAADYAEVRAAMRTLGISEEDQTSLYGVLAAVLHLNNVTFGERDGECTLKDSDRQLLDFVASELLHGDAGAFTRGLTTVTRAVAGERITSPLTADRATEQRDSLCKALYEGVFTWLMKRINALIDASESTASWVGLLDIFGFEKFKKNGFEQVCINLTNEQLQQHYNHCIFTRDMEECRAEGIDTESVVFADNQPTLDLLQGSMGVLSLLDEEVQLGNGSDLAFADKLLAARGSHQSYIKHRTDKATFGVDHYAGVVMYTVDTWREKNMDTLSDQLKVACGSSRDQFVSALVAPPTDIPGRKPTVARMYKESLKDLMRVIYGTNPHWIRCVKPHHNKKKRNFHGQEVMAQLRSAGVLETVRIRKLGYSVRLPFDDFWGRYGAIVGRAAAGGDKRKGCEAVLQRLGVGRERGQVGKTKVFLKSEAWGVFEEARARALTGHAQTVQRHVLLRRARWQTAIRQRRAYVTIMQAFARARASEVQARTREYDARKGELIANARQLLSTVQVEERSRVALMTDEVDELRQLRARKGQDFQHMVARWYATKSQRLAEFQRVLMGDEDGLRGQVEREEQEDLLCALDDLKDDFETMQSRQYEREQMEEEERARALEWQLERERREQEERLRLQRTRAQAAWQRAAEERRMAEDERLMEAERQQRWLRDVERAHSEALALHAQERRQVVREKRRFDQDPFCPAVPRQRGAEADMLDSRARRDRSPTGRPRGAPPEAAPFAAPTFARLAAAGPQKARSLYSAAPARRPAVSPSPARLGSSATRREAGPAKAAACPSVDMVRRLQRMRKQAHRDPSRLVVSHASLFSASSPANPSNPEWAPGPDGTVMLPDGTRCHVDDLPVQDDGPSEY